MGSAGVLMDNYKPLIPIDDAVSLAGLGYDGELRIIVNPTRAWRKAWGAHYELADKDEEAFLAKQYELAASVITGATIKGGGQAWERDNLTADDVRELDEQVDPRLIDLAITEMSERSAAGVVNTRTTFRSERESVLKRRQENQNPRPADSDKRVESDALAE